MLASLTSRPVRAAVVAVAVATTTALACPGPASAVTINQSTVDGARPADLGCRADQTVIYHTLIKDGGEAIGYVDLMASTHCHSVWAHVHTAKVGQNWIPTAWVLRNSDKQAETSYPYVVASDTYSTMLWDKGVTSYAEGTIGFGRIDAAYNQTPSY